MDNKDPEVIRLHDQIADLKAELVELSGKLQSGVDEVEEAARPAVRFVRDHPGAVSSVAITAGLVGLVVGYVLGSAASNSLSTR